MAQTTESLADLVRERGRKATDSAGTAISALAATADALEMAETSSRLSEIDEKLRSDCFRLMVMGRFKNGKSTLLNALLGGQTHPVELQGHQGPMVVDDLPATATLTGVHWSEVPYVKAWRFDGKPDEGWDFPRYLSESTLGNDEEESQERFGHIQEFEMGYPAALCEAGVIVYDTPGLDEHKSRTAITRQASKSCDAAVIVYRSDSLMGQSDLVETATVVAEGTRVFTVVNLMGGRAVDDRLRGYVWNRYVRDQLGGSKWAGEDLATRDIFFVDAARGQEGRYGGDPALAESSGLAALERRLGEFLLRDRQAAHLEKFVTRATTEAKAIQAHIGQRQAAARADQNRLREAFTAILPKLEAIRERPAKLPMIFARYRDEAQVVIRSSFVELIAGIRRDLPAHLEETALPSGESFLKVYKQKKLREEAGRVVSDFVSGRIDDWSEHQAAEALAPVIQRLAGEIEREITHIGRQFEEINLELTGWTVNADGVKLVSTSERVLAAAAGLLFGDLSAAIGGGAGGYRGAAGGITGALGTAFLLGALGVSSAVVFFPVTLAAAFVLAAVAGGHGFERRVKTKVAEQSDDLLRALPDEAAPKMAEQIAAQFDEIEAEVTADLRLVIDSEERNIRSMVDLNQRDQAERDQTLVELTGHLESVAAQTEALQQALTIARQL